jgi:hypothetical protein
MSHIKLLARTEDAKAQEFCRAYWETDADGKPVHKVADIAEKLGVKQQDVVKYVQKHSQAYLAEMVCGKCGDPIVFLKSRADISTVVRERVGREFCPDCQDRIEEQKAEVRRNEKRKLYDSKTKQMQLAFETGVYETLDLLEFKFLVALVSCRNVEAATKRIGLSHQNAEKFRRKFNDLHLINDGIGIEGYYEFIPEFEKALERLSLRQIVNPIFNPQTLKLYRKLKQEHLFVYPEVPIAAFIQRSDVENLLTEGWHSNYFLNARVDFLICDEVGMPLSVVEYHGGHHESEHRTKLDSFKEMILRKAGLAMRAITHQELAELERIVE